MGGLQHEETGEEVVCLFCGQGDECEHLFASFDLSHGEINGGYLFERWDQLEARFLDQAIRSVLDQSVQLRFEKYSSIGNIASAARGAVDQAREEIVKDGGSPDDPEDVDRHQVSFGILDEPDEFLNLLEQSGAEVERHLVEAGGAGYESRAAVAYSAVPADVYAVVEEFLTGWVAETRAGRWAPAVRKRVRPRSESPQPPRRSGPPQDHFTVLEELLRDARNTASERPKGGWIGMQMNHGAMVRFRTTMKQISSVAEARTRDEVERALRKPDGERAPDGRIAAEILQRIESGGWIDLHDHLAPTPPRD